MDFGEKAGIAFAIIIAIGFFSMFTIRWHPYNEYCDIYRATVPFGEFVQTGSLRGVMFFGFGSMSGSYSGEEFYLIKYFDGDELRTLKLYAEDVPLIVDGTFQLEIVSEYSTVKWFFVFPQKEKPQREMFPDYKIHIPYLPEVNQTMREDWTR